MSHGTVNAAWLKRTPPYFQLEVTPMHDPSRCRVLLLLVLLAAPTVSAAETSSMVLEGDVSALFDNGDFVVANGMPARGTSMMAAASPVGSPRTEDKPVSRESTLDVLAKTTIGPDGKFRLEVAVEEPRRAYFYVLNAVSPEGHRLAGGLKGKAFVLEPGQLELRMSADGRFAIKGGDYNQAVFNSWRQSDEYLAALAELERLRKPVNGETEDARRRRVDRMMEAQTNFLDLENESRSRIARTHPDPLVRRLVIETAWLLGPWVLEALHGLAELTPDDRWVTERLAAHTAGAKQAAERRMRDAIGSKIGDFAAKTLAGEEVRLSDVRARSKYVLLEFWASWCVPCRLEIPHMKEAYASYRDRGFEIVSFTIDRERQDWEDASAEEDLPWLNLGMGPEADAPVAYHVTGVPKNYLVNAGTGEIVAKDLRGHHLDEKLAELLD